MFNENDKVVIKTLDVLIAGGDLKLAADLGDVYCNTDKKYVIFPDFNYFGRECTVDNVDSNDLDIPYFLSIGIWVPEFMIENKPLPKPKLEPIIEEVPVDDKNIKVKNAVEQVYINKFNNKPFGKVFVKLIKLDEKVAEFSSTSFSNLRKHELQYIAKILQDNGREVVDYNKLTQKDLAIYCYKKALTL